MARRSKQSSIPSNPSMLSKSVGAGPGVRSTVMYGEHVQVCARAGYTWTRLHFFLTCVSCMHMGEVSRFFDFILGECKALWGELERVSASRSLLHGR